MKSPRTTLTTIIIALVLCVVACDPKPKAAQASRDLALNITQSQHPQTRTPSQPASIDEKRLYLDASLSMRGFVNPQNHSEFDQVIDGLGDLLPGCRVFKYGQSGAEPPANASDLITPVGFGREVHEPAFYSSRFNPDDRLIDKLTNESGSVLSVLLSDGVYSEPAGSTSPPVVQAIQRWLQKGRSLGIFMFKSSFDGPFYSERSRTTSGVNVSVKARPFYAFVFSPTSEALTDLQEKLQRRFPVMRAIRFTPDAIDCQSSLNERLDGTYSYRKPPAVLYHWHMLDSDVFQGNNTVPMRYSVKCAIAPEYPVASLNVAITPAYYRWQNGKFEKSESVLTGYKSELATKSSAGTGSQTGTSGESPTMETGFVVHLPKDSTVPFSFYHLTLTPSVKEMKTNLGVTSTLDDRDLKDAGRTYRFNELLSAIADIHFKTTLASRTSTEIFVTLENR
jgi:hypothetical protein